MSKHPLLMAKDIIKTQEKKIKLLEENAEHQEKIIELMEEQINAQILHR